MQDAPRDVLKDRSMRDAKEPFYEALKFLLVIILILAGMVFLEAKLNG